MTVAGDFRGNVFVNGGQLREMQVSGNIGASSTTPAFGTGTFVCTINARDGIGLVTAANANVNMASYGIGAANNVGLLNTLNVTGSLRGFVDTRQISTVVQARNLDGTIRLSTVPTTPPSLGTLPITARINIRQSITSTGLIDVRAANGLQGQIYVNQQPGLGTGFFTGAVRVNQTDYIKDPQFRPISQVYGSGAVSVGAHCLYHKDCVPEAPQINDTSLPPSDLTLVAADLDQSAQGVLVRFDGPIKSNVANPVAIACMPLNFSADICSGPGWQDVTTAFDIDLPTVGAQGTSARTIRIRANPGMVVGPGIYRATFPSVLSLGVVGEPAVVAPVYCDVQAYYFRVGLDCDNSGDDDLAQDPPPSAGTCATGCGDFNHVDGVTVADIFDFLNAWFAGCPTSPPDPCPADFNGVDGPTVADIFDFLNAWFMGAAAC